MADFGGGFEDNWGLQAVVRGGGGRGTAMRSEFFGGPEDSCFVDDINGGFFFDFPDENLFQGSAAAVLNDDLQELYKPFYPIPDSSSSSAALQEDHILLSAKNEIIDLQKQMSVPDQSAAPCITDATQNIAQTPKYRRRKNQNKRVVVQVKGVDGVLSDKWAWRKYGQKPIKGSPFPRSYYRCSSSKGCLARKQVEQSCTDPGVFNISYAAEHNHIQPIRKNALAGTTRQKFSTDNNKATISGIYKENSSNSSSPNSGDVVRFAAAINIEDGCSSFKQENLMRSGIKMEEEFFAGLEDLDGFVSELSCGQQLYSSQLFNMNFYW